MPKQQLRFRKRWILFLRKAYTNLSVPVALVYLTYSVKVHPKYGMTWLKRIALGFRFWRNHSKMKSGTSWRAHLVMAMRLLEISPNTAGDVVECGCWRGGATVNLSLVAAITGRKLKIYDSFEGLPPPEKGDPNAERAFKNGFVPGVFGGALDTVKSNVRQFGAIDSCEFYKGWFSDTLPHHQGDIVLAFWDVDFHASLHDCIINLWNSVVDGGYVFLDEFRNVPYCSVFYSEKYWGKYFSTVPPGLIGIGTGVQVGMMYPDNANSGTGRLGLSRIMPPHSIAYSIKGTRAIWEYYPDEIEHSAQEPSPTESPADQA